jgi:hypothetical protein
MKPVFLLLCTAVIITVSGSCKKSNSGDDTAKSLLGTWELSSSQASIIPTVNYPPGNGNLLKFTGSGYQSYTNGQLVKSGTYAVVADSTAETSTGALIPAGQFTHRIVYDGDNSGNKVFFQVTGSELRLVSGYFPVDGGSSRIYAKQASDH